MESQQVTSIGRDSSEHVVQKEAVEPSAAATDLAEVARQIQDDCRVDPKAYLEEVHVAAGGE
jgi:hypothetical protein